MQISPRDRIGPYEILARIGAGGMGEVYSARDTRLGRDVAIKVLPSSLSNDPDRIRRFEQEARAAGMLNHPNILAIHDIGTYQDSPYVVSELLQGHTLRDDLQNRGALPLRNALDYAVQIAHGLSAAHEKGIVHRDLKPENLFLTHDGRAKILDFGLAKLAHVEFTGEGTSAPTMTAATMPGAVMGTIGYMSPEQVRGKPVDSRCDIFSFGVVLYEMLAGGRAFQAESAVEIMNAILKEDPPPLARRKPDLPAPLERIVQRCLEKNPAGRFQTATDLAFALESLSTAAPAIAGPAAAKRSLWPLIAALVIAAIAVFAAAFLGRRTAQAPIPEYHQVTFQRGMIQTARFAPDGQTYVYGAAWDDKPMELFSTRQGSSESRSLGLLNAQILAISSTGDMAIMLRHRYLGPLLGVGTLARVPLAGGAPRELLDDIEDADWSPDGKNLAIVRYAGGHSRLEYPIGKVLYESAGAVAPVRFSPDGRRIAFLEHTLGLDAYQIYILDLAANKRTLLHTGKGSYWGFAWAASGDEIWLSGSETGMHAALYAIPLSGRRRLLARAPDILAIRDVSRDGRVLLLRQDFRSPISYVAAGQNRERDLSWLGQSILADAAADASMVLSLESEPAARGNFAIYLRKTNGSPAVRLGEAGIFAALSPDAKWVLTESPGERGKLVLLPTGAGEPKTLAIDGIAQYYGAGWFPDGQRILVVGSEAGRGPRPYVCPGTGGKPVPIAPEGVAMNRAYAISPDNRFLAATGPDLEIRLFPIDGGDPRAVPGVVKGDLPLRWTPDGRALYIYHPEGAGAKAYKLDLASGRKEFWREIMPSDPAGVLMSYGMANVLLTADGKGYFYNYSRLLSELYLVEGLR